MSILNNKKEIETAYSYAEENKKDSISKSKATGAKLAIATVALTGILLGGSAACLYRDCSTNDPTEETCLITELKTKLFGYEAGLKHHYNDLLTNELDNYELSNVMYSEPHTIYALPEGYVLQGDEGVSRIEPIMNKRINEDGTVDTFYSLPEGYVLKKDENGNSYGEKTVSPTRQDLNASISYTKTRTNGITTDETWTYDEDDYLSHEISFGPELRLKRLSR